MKTLVQSAKRLGFFATILCCAACSITGPISIIADNGQILRGSFTASPTAGGSFSVTDGTLSCSGSYDSSDRSRMITIPVRCSDGRFGLVEATRQSGASGSGTVTLNDNAHGLFVFGNARIACLTIGTQLGATAQSACYQENVRLQAEAQFAEQQGATTAAVAVTALSAAAAGFGATYKPPPLLTPPPPYMPLATPTPVPDICTMISCPRPAPPPVQFIPYTPGGGNPSGYGLLAH